MELVTGTVDPSFMTSKRFGGKPQITTPAGVSSLSH